MKKFIVKLFGFGVFSILFFILINILYTYVIVKTDFDVRKRLEALNFKDPDFKLLVLGASTSLDGFDTELLTMKGIKAYNLAIGGATVKTNYFQLTEYLSAYKQRPEFVLLGLNEVMVKSFDDELLHPLIEVTMQNHKYAMKDVPILKFKWLGFEFLKKIVSKNHRKAKLSYGQLKFRGINTDYTNYSQSQLNIEEYKSSYWIGEIARLCAENSITLMVLEMPGYKEIQNINPVGPYELCFKNGQSAYLYNFGSQEFCKIFDAGKDWIGNSHLNEFGAIKFTNELFPILKNISIKAK